MAARLLAERRDARSLFEPICDKLRSAAIASAAMKLKLGTRVSDIKSFIISWFEANYDYVENYLLAGIDER